MSPVNPRSEDADPAVEGALRAQPLWPLPEGLASRVVGGLPSRAGGSPVLELVGRLSAAAAVLTAAWLALADAAPALADVAGVTGPRPSLAPVVTAAPIAPDPRELVERVPASGSAAGEATACGGAGLALIALGAWLSRRWRSLPPKAA